MPHQRYQEPCSAVAIPLQKRYGGFPKDCQRPLQNLSSCVQVLHLHMSKVSKSLLLGKPTHVLGVIPHSTLACKYHSTNPAGKLLEVARLQSKKTRIQDLPYLGGSLPLWKGLSAIAATVDYLSALACSAAPAPLLSLQIFWDGAAHADCDVLLRCHARLCHPPGARMEAHTLHTPSTSGYLTGGSVALPSSAKSISGTTQGADRAEQLLSSHPNAWSTVLIKKPRVLNLT